MPCTAARCVTVVNMDVIDDPYQTNTRFAAAPALHAAPHQALLHHSRKSARGCCVTAAPVEGAAASGVGSV